MSIIEMLKPAAYAPAIQNQEVVEKKYNYWRFRIFYGLYIGYGFYFFTRKSFTFAMPALMQDLGLQISDVGILSSIFSITYGLSKFLSGVVADRSNPRFFMAFGLILTGVFNILFGLSSSILWFALFWGMNGWFQGWGWPPCVRLLTHWYSQRERGRWWAFWNTSHNLGGALIPFVAAFCASLWGWRYVMYVPGITCIGIGFFLINRLRDIPQSLGLPPIEEFKGDYPEEKSIEEKDISVKEILFTYVLKNKYMWIVAVAYFFLYVIRQAMNDFIALFLITTKGYSLMMANTSIFWFEMGGLCGCLVAGWASDVIFQGRRGPVNLICCISVVLSILGFYLIPHNVVFLDYLLVALIGFFILGPHMLLGVAAVEISHKKAAGTAMGFIGWWSYLGAAMAGYPITKIIESYGWHGFFSSLAVCGAITVLFLIPLWKIKSKPKPISESIATRKVRRKEKIVMEN